MEKGKFSQPRPYRDEERQIEEAFRQVTAQKAPPRHPRPIARDPDTVLSASDETLVIPAEELFQDTPYEARQTGQIPQPAAEPPIEDVIEQQIMAAYPEEIPVPRESELPEPEEAELEPEGLLDKLILFCFTNKKGVLAGLCAAVLILLIAIIAVIVSTASGGNSDVKIPDNVIIAGVNVGGMTQNEAVNAVKRATSHTYSAENMVVEIGDTTLYLSPKDTGAALDVKAAVNAALEYGQTGLISGGEHTIGLLPYLQLDTDFIRQELGTLAADTGSTLTQVSYGLEGSYPSLDPEKFDPASAQTLVLTMGTPGVSFDVDKVYNQVLDAYSLHSFRVVADDVRPTAQPDPVDLQAIYEEFYVAPKDSTLDRQTFEVIPGSYGYAFDLEAAQKLVDAAKYGDVLRIPMHFLEPELLDDTVLFRDVLGEAQTTISGTNARMNNIRLACEAMNGTIVQPGELFSYNTCLGEPSEYRGYLPAPDDSVPTPKEVVGGGITQGASTLYYCALLSDMEIVSHTNLSSPVSYIDFGLDAAVSWNGSDFKFRNNTGYPVQIKAAISGNTLSVQILGTEERDYFVKMDYEIIDVYDSGTEHKEFPHNNAEGYQDGDVIQEAATGYSVKTYKLKYSRSSGKLLSKDYVSNSRYPARDKIVAQVLPPETTAPEMTFPEPTIPETTVPQETESQWELPSEEISADTGVLPAA